MAWQDVTGYAHGERLKGVEPRSWELRFGGLRLVLTQHIAEKGKWFTYLEPLYGLHEIGTVGEDVDNLKRLAVAKAERSMVHHAALLASNASEQSN